MNGYEDTAMTASGSSPSQVNSTARKYRAGRVVVYYCQRCGHRWQGPRVREDGARCELCGSSRIGMNAPHQVRESHISIKEVKK